MAACTRYTQHIWKDFLKYGGHDAVSKGSMTISRCTPGYVDATLKIQKEQTNRLGTLHGGIICSLVDTVGSLALTTKGIFQTGVSTDIHTTFIRAAGKTGDTVRIEGRVLNMGKTLAYTETKLFHPETGKLLASGLHTKYIAASHGHPQNVVFDETGETIVQGSFDEGDNP